MGHVGDARGFAALDVEMAGVVDGAGKPVGEVKLMVLVGGWHSVFLLAKHTLVAPARIGLPGEVSYRVLVWKSLVAGGRIELPTYGL